MRLEKGPKAAKNYNISLSCAFFLLFGRKVTNYFLILHQNRVLNIIKN